MDEKLRFCFDALRRTWPMKPPEVPYADQCNSVGDGGGLGNGGGGKGGASGAGGGFKTPPRGGRPAVRAVRAGGGGGGVETLSGIGEPQMKRLLLAVVTLSFPHAGRGEVQGLVRQLLEDCGFRRLSEAAAAASAVAARAGQAVPPPTVVLDFDDFRVAVLTSPVLIQCLEQWMSGGAM